MLISSEMEELIGMSDRIIVLAEGRMTGELQKEEFNQDTILRMASNLNNVNNINNINKSKFSN